MPIFFMEYEKMHCQLYKEDVPEFTRKYSEFFLCNRTAENRFRGIGCLENLISIQDPRIAYTIEEYKNKHYPYIMSKFAVEVERMTVRLENFCMEGGNLSTNYFVRIENTIKNLSKKIIQEVLEEAIENELFIPHPNSEKPYLKKKSIRENIYGKWKN